MKKLYVEVCILSPSRHLRHFLSRTHFQHANPHLLRQRSGEGPTWPRWCLDRGCPRGEVGHQTITGGQRLRFANFELGWVQHCLVMMAGIVTLSHGKMLGLDDGEESEYTWQPPGSLELKLFSVWRLQNWKLKKTAALFYDNNCQQSWQRIMSPETFVAELSFKISCIK